jgi:DNA-binding response OmpR family regulator
VTDAIRVLALRPLGDESVWLPPLAPTHRLRVERTVAAALDAAIADHPRVVIVDALPDIGGATRLIRLLRAGGAPFDLRFILLAARCDLVALAAVMRQGADVMLWPPLEPSDLIRAVDRMVRPSNGRGGGHLGNGRRCEDRRWERGSHTLRAAR